ncbi:ATP-binding protein [Streptomyces sp. NBC_01497]|uniref:ATP-binding protein n=1 Tax=Streptomyces sp. NBC_01497 TaxID=2903885 RepID=UPI002E374D4E|nr:ATP-binding protein [Streptomyces sp. NBC_01497]
MTPQELRGLFLFEKLDEKQLGWLSERGRLEQRTAGSFVYREGEPATCFYVLLSGTVALSREMHGDDVETSRTEQRGVYAGSTQAYLGDRVDQTYKNSLRAISDSEFFVLAADEFATAVRTWFPMALHLLEGLFFGYRAANSLVNERERLLALGSLSAGLTHELNNPAAAAVRATEALRDRVAGMRHKLALIADGRLDGSRLHQLVELQDTAVKQAASAPSLSALETSDAEDVLSDWLDERGVVNPWDIAPTLVAGGVGVPWLETVADTVGDTYLDSAVRWLAYAIDTELLMGEIDDAVTRVSDLVGAAKKYSQLDRAPQQTVDVHELLEATLTMLRAKIPTGIRIVKDYDRTLPEVPAYGAELNQVWTNLIDNAVDAMGTTGTLSIRTWGDDNNHLLVGIGDTGTGIAPEIRPRIFEPFFTTKGVGEGTGLGLDISYRIVVNKHHGDIRVESRPGDTQFIVCLPMTQEEEPGPEGPEGADASPGSSAAQDNAPTGPRPGTP